MMNLLLCRDEVMRPFCSGRAHLFLYTEKRPATLVSFWKLLLIFTGRLLHRPVFTVFFSVTHWMYFVAVHLLIFLIRFYECLYFLTFVYKSGQFTARLFHKIWENTFFFYFFSQLIIQQMQWPQCWPHRWNWTCTPAWWMSSQRCKHQAVQRNSKLFPGISFRKKKRKKKRKYVKVCCHLEVPDDGAQQFKCGCRTFSPENINY